MRGPRHAARSLAAFCCSTPILFVSPISDRDPVVVNRHHLAKKSAEYSIPRPETVSNKFCPFLSAIFFLC